MKCEGKHKNPWLGGIDEKGAETVNGDEVGEFGIGEFGTTKYTAQQGGGEGGVSGGITVPKFSTLDDVADEGKEGETGTPWAFVAKLESAESKSGLEGRGEEEVAFSKGRDDETDIGGTEIER